MNAAVPRSSEAWDIVREGGQNAIVNEWRHLAECLVELDVTIEELESWATRREDIAELEQLERLRDDVQTALELHHLSSRLRRRVHERHHLSVMRPIVVEPHD